MVNGLHVRGKRATWQTARLPHLCAAGITIAQEKVTFVFGALANEWKAKEIMAYAWPELELKGDALGTTPSPSLLSGESGILSEPPTRRRAVAASAATAI
jgi:hypothetical protein